MGKSAELAAVALVRSISEQANVQIPRMQLHILIYLADHSYVAPHGLPRSDLALLAARYGRSESRVEHAMHDLVEEGAVREWQDQRGTVYYSYNPDWRPRAKEPA